jgi:hypothetical protein
MLRSGQDILKDNEAPTIEEFELYPPGTVKMP